MDLEECQCPLQAWLQIVLTLVAIFLVSIPLGRYMARVVTGQSTMLDRIFDPIDNAIYFLIGRRICEQAMTLADRTRSTCSSPIW